MPRGKQVESCMICAPESCSCFAKPRKASPPRTSPVVLEKAEPPVPVRVPVRSEAARAAMKAAVRRTETNRYQRRFAPVSLRPPRVRVEELQLNNALRALAPLMAPEELDRYKMIVGSVPHVQDRATVWRAQHGKF